MKMDEFLKVKLDNKNERATTKHEEVFTIRMQAEKKNLDKETESLKGKSDKIYLIIGSNLWCFFIVGKRERYA